MAQTKPCSKCGLLCNNCNMGIAWFKDNPTLLLRAAVYLEIEEE